MKKLVSLTSFLPVMAVAHEGHGIESASHYHATDVWGFVAFACVVAVMWWLGRDK
ncbi:MAG TPA: hypothetical protein PKY33_00680 [Limnohabitans sp.]|jgi:hypothetical protein|uniref:hypothetical protein n=1 Tax=Limnohabitans sp. TaxID=1907725 RepID=UPI0026A4AB44|nr:hypothetical protein [Limnohabitans sp.]HQR85237.1 hypothetical protein [Limnohabitans sp.]HQS27354.1 hypothetical protein [Limnohabitans sp.]